MHCWRIFAGFTLPQPAVGFLKSILWSSGVEKWGFRASEGVYSVGDGFVIIWVWSCCSAKWTRGFASIKLNNGD